MVPPVIAAFDPYSPVPHVVGFDPFAQALTAQVHAHESRENRRQRRHDQRVAHVKGPKCIMKYETCKGGGEGRGICQRDFDTCLGVLPRDNEF